MKSDLEAALVTFLKASDHYPPPAHYVRHIETHISHVFLTGEYAYKLKKPVAFDFVDFSTLEKRKHFCEEELRLNSRFAPELYLEVIPICRCGNSFSIGAGGEVVEYLIKMRQFDEESLFDRLAARGALRSQQLIQITDVISKFHIQAERQPEYWGFEYVREAMARNLRGCQEFSPRIIDPKQLAQLERLSSTVLCQKQELIKARQKTHVRALHGDLHLKNMCIFKNRAALFDGIEFNPELSNCDIWADLAFFIMDLLFRGLEAEAALVWNHYLQEVDDFQGFELLDLYVSYRAAIRARINCLEVESAESFEEKNKLAEAAQKYVALALRSLEPHPRRLIAIGGLAGTGKSTLASLLAQKLQAVHIRSDAVRKHLCGIEPMMRAPQTAYSAEMNIRTYREILHRASHVLESDRTAILDAVFHSPAFREEVERYAREMKIPFVGYWCEVSPQTAKERVRQRTGDISDADESVIVLQQAYELGDITWQRVDTSLPETQVLSIVLSRL